MLFVSVSGCHKIVLTRAGSSSYCRPSVNALIKDFDSGNYRSASLDETVDLLECVEVLSN